MKARKYCYLWVVQGNYGYCGWEDVAASESHREARANLREYRENEPQYPHRIIHRRELNIPEQDPFGADAVSAREFQRTL